VADFCSLGSALAAASVDSAGAEVVWAGDVGSLPLSSAELSSEDADGFVAGAPATGWATAGGADVADVAS
jgi:hypothetical protein